MYADFEGKSPIRDFLDGLSEKELAKSLAYITALSEHGSKLTANYVKHIEGELWELRPEYGGVEMRYFYFTWVNNVIVIVHSLKKKRQKLPRRDIKLALKRTAEVKSGEAHIVQVIPK